MIPDSAPGQTESIEDFLKLAERLDRGDVKEEDLSAIVGSLPLLSHSRLDAVAYESKGQADRNPRLGWAIAKIADETAVYQGAEPLLQAQAAWYLGRAANSYFRPKRAFAALDRARKAFVELEEVFWVAACDWQQHVVAWAKTDLYQSTAEVQAALDILSSPNSPLQEYANDCRLTLAYIQMLTGKFQESHDLLATCETNFRQARNQSGLIRCHLIRGNALRRQSASDRARLELENCVNLAELEQAPVQEALGLTQLAYVLNKRSRSLGTYKDAEGAFLKAAALFNDLDLTFWEALCLDGLASIDIGRGNLAKAAAKLVVCLRVYEEYAVPAPLADVLTTLGWMETYRANYEKGLGYLLRAESLIKPTGNKFSLGKCMMHLGEIYSEMGLYQQSLRYLEQSLEIFQQFESPGSVAECGLRLAGCWTNLGRPSEATKILKIVANNAKEAKQENIFPYLYIRQAEALFLDDNHEETRKVLEKANQAAVDFKDVTGAAVAQRLLGEVLTNLGELLAATKFIEKAEKIFDEKGLVIEQAACKIAWGNYFQRSGDVKSAEKAFRQAAKLGQNLAPDILWQAEAGLASLAADAGRDSDALEHYRQVIASLVRLRQDIWQPALAGFFVKRPIDSLNQALRLAVRLDSPDDILEIIEAGKAQVMANLFRRGRSLQSSATSPELEDLAAGIRWRQEQARAMIGNSRLLPSVDLLRLRSETQEMVKAYDLLRGRIERQYQPATEEIKPGKGEFDLNRFREKANRSFGENWLALDYYLTANQLTCILISPDFCEYVDIGYSGRVKMAFAGLDRAQQTGQWREEDLQVLGRWLLPNIVTERLNPENTETILLVAPHRQLHRLPWAALKVDGNPLVTRAVPVVVPSLQSLVALLDRETKNVAIGKGLLVAVSEFNGRHKRLPQTVNEVQALARLYPKSEVLINEAAVWDGLDAMLGPGGRDYSFLHVASHAFADKVSGRLSGLALFDRDVWLDELWDFFPLPPLVTLSACSGSKSKLYEGDEQVGLATTCLAAGARQVVASLWPIQDGEAAELMETFYGQLVHGYGAARSLAEAQRAAIQNKKASLHWGGFRCTGLPA